MPRNNNRRRRGGRRGRRNGNVSTGPSRSPRVSLRRTFRDFKTVQLNNIQGTGLDAYSYYSKYVLPDPTVCSGFRDTQQTFEFWKIRRFRIRVQPGYNAYNQSYNTVNLDALAAMQIWTASDYSANESISGVSIMSYNNAKCHTLSLNGIKTVVNTQCRINQKALTPTTIMPGNTWLDTSTDISNSNIYSGAQIFARMQGQTTTNYMATLQLIFEYDVEFKQPAFQNRPDSFELGIVGSKLITIPDGSTTDTREYVCSEFKIVDTGYDYRFVRSDGEPGSLNYTGTEMFNVYFQRSSGKYFDNRFANYIGPVPRKPDGWTPPVSA